MVIFLRISHELRTGERLGSMKEEKPEVSFTSFRD